MTDPQQPRAGWMRLLLSARDNMTPAIGRVIGFALSIVILVLIINAMVSIDTAKTAEEGHARAENWHALFSAMEYFVPAMCLAIGGLISGTNFTEPKPRDQAGGTKSDTGNANG